jgi:hypothetical protein
VIRELSRQHLEQATRRHFLFEAAAGLGSIWLAETAAAEAAPASGASPAPRRPAGSSGGRRPGVGQRAAKARRVIYLHMVGAPSQLELFDYKPVLARFDGRECPQSYLEGQRFAFIQGVPLMMGPQYPFAQQGASGAWVSDRLPRFAQLVDDVCFIKTLQTDQFNHGPAQLMVHCGQPRVGYPSIGSWVTWGLGTEQADLPGYLVLISGGRLPRVGKALWGAGFLPSVYQGVQCRSKGDPVLNVTNPEGITSDIRRAALDSLARLNRRNYELFGDPETLTRIAQYEMAFRMQEAVPEAMDLSDEPAHIHELYGTEPGKESLANNCLLARRLAERGVRYIQLYDWGWDSHGASQDEALNGGFQDKCRMMDRAVSALLIDLKQRGLLEDTLVVWSGEFGRTSMRENRGGAAMKLIGRDHNPNAFTMWLAGAGIRAGMTYGETDEMGYLPARDPVQLRDFHATLLHLLGIDFDTFSVPFQGLAQKLTGVKPCRVLQEILA